MEAIAEEHKPVSLIFGHGDPLPDETSQLRCEILSDISNPHKITKVAVTNERGKMYLGNPIDSNLCVNYIVVRKKRTNSVRYYPVNNFFMCPYQEQEALQTTSSIETRSARESLTALNNIMGSKKTKNRLKSAENNAANLANLKKTVDQVVEAEESKFKPTISSSPLSSVTYLPPCDRNTTKVEEAYRIHDLVSEEILDSLTLTAQEIMKMDVLTLAGDTRFSNFMMKAASHIPKDLMKYKLLIIVDRLLAFKQATPRLLSDKNHRFCSFSETLNAKLIEDFTISGVRNKRICSPTMRDKILSYAMVLIMMCCGYAIDIGLLAGVVTSVEHKRLPALLRALGAKSGRNFPSIFKLNVPIGKPPAKIQRRSTKLK